VFGSDFMKKYILLLIIFVVIVSLSLFFLLGNDKEASVNTNSRAFDAREIVDESADNKIINYIDEEDNRIEKIMNDVNSNDNKSKIKEVFISLTDFIFYDGEINGVKFSDLKDSTKEKILNFWYKLDSKIDEKYPLEKEEIKNSAIKSYNTIKVKAGELKEKLINKYKEEIGEDRYNFQIEKGTSIKEKVKDKANNTKNKISDWYANFKEGN